MNQFWVNVPVFTTLKLRKTVRLVFCDFQKVENWNICSKWVKWLDLSIQTRTRNYSSNVLKQFLVSVSWTNTPCSSSTQLFPPPTPTISTLSYYDPVFWGFSLNCQPPTRQRSPSLLETWEYHYIINLFIVDDKSTIKNIFRSTNVALNTWLI